MLATSCNQGTSWRMARPSSQHCACCACWIRLAICTSTGFRCIRILAKPKELRETSDRFIHANDDSKDVHVEIMGKMKAEAPVSEKFHYQKWAANFHSMLPMQIPCLNKLLRRDSAGLVWARGTSTVPAICWKCKVNIAKIVSMNRANKWLIYYIPIFQTRKKHFNKVAVRIQGVGCCTLPVLNSNYVKDNSACPLPTWQQAETS